MSVGEVWFFVICLGNISLSNKFLFEDISRLGAEKHFLEERKKLGPFACHFMEVFTLGALFRLVTEKWKGKLWETQHKLLSSSNPFYQQNPNRVFYTTFKF